MFKYTKLQNDAYSIFGFKITGRKSRRDSYLNCILQLVLNVDRKLAYDLYPHLSSVKDNGTTTNDFMEAFISFLNDYKEIMEKSEFYLSNSTVGNENFDTNMTVIKVNDLKSEEVFLKAKEINEKDSSHIIKAFTSLNSDSCFFSFLLNQINDYMHSDTYSEYRDIEETFGMNFIINEEEKDTKKNIKSDSKIRLSTIDVSKILSKIRNNGLRVFSKKNKIQHKLFHFYQLTLGKTKKVHISSKKETMHYFKMDKNKAGRLLTFRLKYKKDIVKDQNEKEMCK